MSLPRHALLVSVSLVLFWAVPGELVSGGSAGAARAATDPREIRAREAFAAGNYQEAIDLFAKLYAETLHPTYQRNIGRAYQNLAVPDKAIASFRDYLRKAKDISAREREEIEGYIAEMEALRERQARQEQANREQERQRRAQATPVATSRPPDVEKSSEQPTLIPTAPRSPEAGSAPAGLTMDAGRDEGGQPVYQKWWFWAIAVGVVGGTIAALAAGGAFDRTSEPACDPDRMCL